MIKKRGKIGSAFALVVWLGSASSAFASWVTFDIVWTGVGSLSGASVTGFITFDDASVPELRPPDDGEISLPSLTRVSDLAVTITGASSGNGTFSLSDFDRILFWSAQPLDLTKELIGQGCFGTSDCGDFNLFAATEGAPDGVFNFILCPDGVSCEGQGEAYLQVTSMTPGEARIPEPTTLALFGLGLAGLGAMRRRRIVS